MASGGPAAIFAARSRAAGRRRSGGYTAVTMPRLRASWASIISPMKISSHAFASPDTRQEVGAAPVGMQAPLDERLAEASGRGGQTDVAGEREVHSGAGGGAVDGGDDRLGRVAHRHEHAVALGATLSRMGRSARASRASFIA